MDVLATEKQPAPVRKRRSNPNRGGYRANSGRKKGVPNKLTSDMKAAIVEAFDRAGGVDYLVSVAQSDPKTFCALIGRVLPLQVSGEGGGPIVITWGAPDEQ